MDGTIKFVRTTKSARTPNKQYAGDVGFDLYVSEDVVIPPREVRDVPTGLRIELPKGLGARIVGRSSTIRKRGLMVWEGIIDQGYRGDMFFAVYNPGDGYATIKTGERLAQLILVQIHRVEWMEFEVLNDSYRQERGFGSSGT